MTIQEILETMRVSAVAESESDEEYGFGPAPSDMRIWKAADELRDILKQAREALECASGLLADYRDRDLVYGDETFASSSDETQIYAALELLRGKKPDVPS